VEVEAALIRPVLRRLFWLAAEDRGLLLEPLEPPVRTCSRRSRRWALITWTWARPASARP